jgi:hypothetical protein
MIPGTCRCYLRLTRPWTLHCWNFCASQKHWSYPPRDCACQSIGAMDLKTMDSGQFTDGSQSMRYPACLPTRISHPLHIDPAAARKHRDSIQFTAIMPNHAGDALFLHSHSTRSPLTFRAWRSTKPTLTSFKMRRHSFKPSPLTRHKLTAVPTLLPAKRFATANIPFVQRLVAKGKFLRLLPTSRNYNTTEFHLIDHFAFALGHSPLNEGELVIRTRSMPARAGSPRAPHSPAKILLHFDAGWPLKVYPSSSQTALIELLQSRGHEITVLAPPGYSHPNVKATTFNKLSDFIALANANHILVGMDSFPSHYCAHVLGLPTLCLFANTKPVNSNAMASEHYMFLEQALSCRPCYANCALSSLWRNRVQKLRTAHHGCRSD